MFGVKRTYFLVLTMILGMLFGFTASGSEHAVCIDPGHQGNWVDMSAPEPMAPGSDQMKAKATTGTQGTTTGVPEYQLNLDISLALEKELLQRGYEVVLTRSDNDTAISNSERALLASEKGCDITVRIHANGSTDPGISGALAMVMSQNNPYVGELFEESYRLATSVLGSYCMETGFTNLGIQPHDDMTGINWSQVPVMILEMGYMSNSGDDTQMQDPEMQKKMVQGIADGIDGYFRTGEEEEPGTGDMASDAQEQASEEASEDAALTDERTEGEMHPEPAPSGIPVAGVSSMMRKETAEDEGAPEETALYSDAAFLADPVMAELYNQYIASREQQGQIWAVGIEKLDPAAKENGEDAENPSAETENSSEAEAARQTEDISEEISENLSENEMVSQTEGETDEKAEEKQESTQKAEEAGSGEIFEYHGDIVMQSASVVKVFIMGAVYDRIVYPKDEAHTVHYNGDLHSLLEPMITVSSNEAANALIEILGEGNFQKGAEVIREFCMEYGYFSTSIGRRFLESNPTGDNYTSAHDCRKILSDIYYGKCVNAQASEQMLGFLKGQTVRHKIPSGLPAGFSCANKTGEMPEGYGLGCIENDMAIVNGPDGDYVLCVLSNNLQGDNGGAQQNISAISSYIAGKLYNN